MKTKKDKSLAASVYAGSYSAVRGEIRQSVSVGVSGFNEVSAYYVGGQIAFTLGGHPANLTAYLSNENASKSAELIVKACAQYEKMHGTRTSDPNPASQLPFNTKGEPA